MKKPEILTRLARIVSQLQAMLPHVAHLPAVNRDIGDIVVELERDLEVIEANLSSAIDQLMANRFQRHLHQLHIQNGTVGKRPAPLTPEEEWRAQRKRSRLRLARDLHAEHLARFPMPFEQCVHPACVEARK